jgi:hypothetical protein
MLCFLSYCTIQCSPSKICVDVFSYSRDPTDWTCFSHCTLIYWTLKDCPWWTQGLIGDSLGKPCHLTFSTQEEWRCYHIIQVVFRQKDAPDSEKFQNEWHSSIFKDPYCWSYELTNKPAHFYCNPSVLDNIKCTEVLRPTSCPKGAHNYRCQAGSISEVVTPDIVMIWEKCCRNSANAGMFSTMSAISTLSIYVWIISVTESLLPHKAIHFFERQGKILVKSIGSGLILFDMLFKHSVPQFFSRKMRMIIVPTSLGYHED